VIDDRDDHLRARQDNRASLDKQMVAMPSLALRWLLTRNYGEACYAPFFNVSALVFLTMAIFLTIVSHMTSEKGLDAALMEKPGKNNWNVATCWLNFATPIAFAFGLGCGVFSLSVAQYEVHQHLLDEEREMTEKRERVEKGHTVPPQPLEKPIVIIPGGSTHEKPPGIATPPPAKPKR